MESRSCRVSQCYWAGSRSFHRMEDDVISGIGDLGLMRWKFIKPKFVEVDRILDRGTTLESHNILLFPTHF